MIEKGPEEEAAAKAAALNKVNDNKGENEKKRVEGFDNRQRNKYKGVADANQKSWEGDEPKIGGVLGLRSEWMEKKVSFEVFLEKMTDYTLREIKNSRDVVSAVRDMKHPKKGFEKINMPTELSDVQKKSSIEVAIQEQRIKLYAIREAEMRSNLDKIYGLVKGQCST
jgi:hypothetical protein